MFITTGNVPQAYCLEVQDGRIYFVDAPTKAHTEEEEGHTATKLWELPFDFDSYPGNCFIDGYYNFMTQKLEEHDVTKIVDTRLDTKTTLNLNHKHYIKLYTIVKHDILPEPVVIVTAYVNEPEAASEESKLFTYYEGEDKRMPVIAGHYFPAFKAAVTDRYVSRKKFLSKLDPNNSLAYLEAQLDLLTQIVFIMLQEQPELRDRVCELFAGMTELQTVFSTTSVMSIKPVQQCLQEIRETKAAVREQQRIYFESREA